MEYLKNGKTVVIRKDVVTNNDRALARCEKRNRKI